MRCAVCLRLENWFSGTKGIRKEDGKPCWSFHDGFKVESVDTCSLMRPGALSGVRNPRFAIIIMNWLSISCKRPQTEA